MKIFTKLYERVFKLSFFAVEKHCRNEKLRSHILQSSLGY